MTIPPLNSSPASGAQFDTGPLSWVMSEIRESLNRSRTALQEAITQDDEARSTSLRHAKSYLHQAHGALQIVDIDGIALLTETVEDLFDRVDNGQLTFGAALVHAIGQAYQALIEYLEELLSGLPHQPVRLFPYYRALLEVRGAERIHPADLFFPNLSARVAFPGAPETTQVDYGRMRKRFERVLLPFLKSAQREAESAHVSAMGEVIAEIESAQANPQLRTFWWVMHGLAEAVAAGQIGNEVYVKQLFARINLQIRRLGQGSSSIAERLLRDALFFIARIEMPSARAQQIRQAFQLDGLVPSDYDAKRYGQVDIDALAAAKERLATAKSVWNRIAAGDGNAADSFEHEMHMLAESGSRLNAAALSKLLRELKGIARHAAHSKPGDMLGLEMATSLLFIENALNNITRLGDNFNERAEAIIARLLAVVAGERPGTSAEWLDDMSREAQQRQTMAAVAAEMQTSLRQVEKMLDEYFRDPSQAAALAQLDQTLHQIEGALAVLDQDDATRTLREIRKAVQHFAALEEGGDTEQQHYNKVAQNVGALSFLIESLQLNPESAKSRFLFDEERGVLQARMVDRNASRPSSGTNPDNALGDGPVFQVAPPTVEEELRERQRQSAELAMSLSVQPEDRGLQEQLKESLEHIRQAAALVDNPEANDRAQAGIDILERPDFASSREALVEIITATVPVQTMPAPLPPVVAPESEEAIDAELLEIFLSEAEEVLAAVAETLPLSRSVPHNQEHLTTLRRSFHTLKGSGRMVGLTAFGEAAWAIEQVLNLRLAESRSGDADLYALLEHAAQLLGAWVQDLKNEGRSARTPQALIAAAERVKAGEGFEIEAASVEVLAAPQADVITEDVLDAVEEPSQSLPSVQFEADDVAAVEEDLPPLDVAALDVTLEEDARQAPAMSLPLAEPVEVLPVADVIEFPTASMPAPTADDNIKHIGTLEISVPLFNIYLAETDDLVRLLAHDFSEWRHEPERPVNVQAVNAAHSLAGSSATVGFNDLHEIAHALEMVLQLLMRRPTPLLEQEFESLEQTIERLKAMLQIFALGEMPPHSPEFAKVLQSLRQAIELRLNKQSQPVSVTYAEPTYPAASPSTTLNEPASAAAADDLVNPIAGIDNGISLGEADPIAPVDTPVEAATLYRDDLDADLLPIFFEEGRDILPQMSSALRAWQQRPQDASLPQSLLRQLHTLKGSARMAGAMTLGQHLHDMEARIEGLMRLEAPSALALDDLLMRYDQALQLFDQLQNPGEVSQVVVPDNSPQPVDVQETALPVEQAQESVTLDPVMPLSPQQQESSSAPVPLSPQLVPAAPQTATSPLVRVRADILDRLVNQAGEVSIARSKLENEVGSLRQSLGELTENVSRLRDQLREIEMQAETQIASQMAQSTDREFDPLEFDRFTRLQELTRMMAESVNDVGSVHHSLTRTLESATNDLNNQARLTRELQQDLMRVRMVQFASISERLFRVSRQAAKEVDKRVNLDIRGGSVELDRGVLEKMTGPFEHLLRNAIVHGIEAREQRRANGKDEIGELLIEARQEGNEVVISFTDDGQGLNLQRIREKATNLGLLGSEDTPSDKEVGDLIFHPGFSTADEVTELAGRGVGMDVVRSEAAALGGRVATDSEPGKGTRFTIHLPLTLAVTQVVLLSTGGVTYAVPSVLVEQVQQLKTAQLTAAYNEGAVVWQGQRVPLHYLATLLGDRKSAPVTQQYSPLVILKSGTERVAVHVDEILGNREVVVKNIGPQLARMIGIAGATVLGSGDIVLILNPVPLAQRQALENIRAPRLAPSDVPDSMGAVAEFRQRELTPSASEPVQGLRTQPIIMVVDDSLTVRRVTQRLLTREGFQVVLAKDGVDALERLQSITPDVMLVDIEMPRMDGFDLTRNVRDDERTRSIPIIMITSRTATKHRNYALELGVNHYLGKPYQEDQLLELIGGYVAKPEAAE